MAILAARAELEAEMQRYEVEEHTSLDLMGFRCVVWEVEWMV